MLEDPWAEPPADIWTLTVDPLDAPDVPTYVEVGFAAGVPPSRDGEELPLSELIAKLNLIAGSCGYGRIDMIENRYVGLKSRECYEVLKSRECYEVPAGLALIQAHKALEDLCLERDVLHHKLALEQLWADQVYNGRWFSPFKQALDAFMAATQHDVTGTVRLKLYKGGCVVAGRKSSCALYDPALATYENDARYLRERRGIRPEGGEGLHRYPGAFDQDLGDEGGRAHAGRHVRAHVFRCLGWYGRFPHREPSGELLMPVRDV